MNFFEHQDQARKRTGWLVAMFILAVFCIMAMVYLLVLWLIGGQGADIAEVAMNPGVILGVMLFVLLIVGGGSAYKVSELSAGGRVVAEALGGRRLDPNTVADPYEKRLLNIVEEMAIASGTTVPPVYLMEEEGINAFAAGYSPKDAVIGVTRGSMMLLNRDELQGVIAHEFAHILNGDMRLNIRLMGVIHGILVLGIVGYYLLRSGMYSGMRSSRNKKGGNPLPLFGLGLMLVGFAGTFFGNLIKAAVSRQREYLADASAVQFTRNPDGIAGALKKIGGWIKGSKMENPRAREVSHMLFGDGISRIAGSLFATHPPLDERIRRIDPSFKGQYTKAGTAEAPESPRAARAAMGFAGAAPAAPERNIMAQIGQPSAAHIDHAAALLASLPQPVLDAAHEPYGARAVIYGLLISPDSAVRAKQLEHLGSRAGAGLNRETMRLLPLMPQVNPAARLPLLDIAIGALSAMSPPQYEAFRRDVEALVRADDRIDLFEWTIEQMLFRHLDAHFRRPDQAAVRYRQLQSLSAQTANLLSTLAYAGNTDTAAAQQAFAAGAKRMNLTTLRLQPVRETGLKAVASALDHLSLLAPREKQRLIEGLATCVAADRQVTVREAELFRAIADALDCPVPPLLPGQTLT